MHAADLNQPLDIIAASSTAVPADLDIRALHTDVWAANAPAALLLAHHRLIHKLLPAPDLSALGSLQDELLSGFRGEVEENDPLGQAGLIHAIWRTQLWEWRYQVLLEQVRAGRALRLVLCARAALAPHWLLLAEQLDVPVCAGAGT